MAKWQVLVEETLSRIVEVDAAKYDDAIDKVREMYRNEEIVLDADDFYDVEFLPKQVEV